MKKIQIECVENIENDLKGVLTTPQVDFNLYGMGYIRLSKALFRGELPAGASLPPRGWLGRDCYPDPAALNPGALSNVQGEL